MEAQDAVEQCPATYTGCRQHTDCGEGGYCFSCDRCQLSADSPNASSCWPCPTLAGGSCAPVESCLQRSDSIMENCPLLPGCASHNDCPGDQYCQNCSKCEAESVFSEDCLPCPTAHGGTCRAMKSCSVSQDAIDGSCPQPKGCGSEDQCNPDEYCMSCAQCNQSAQGSGTTSYGCSGCPSRLGGNCVQRSKCAVIGNVLGGGQCPEFRGCARHEDCKSNEFCKSWAATCAAPRGNCKHRPPSLGGFCDAGDCSPGLSIDGQCEGDRTCSDNEDCGVGYYCGLWSDCNTLNPQVCGRLSLFGQQGSCLPLELCVSGVVRPAAGPCPPNGAVTITVKEVLGLNDTFRPMAIGAFGVWGEFGRWAKDNVLLPGTLGSGEDLHGVIQVYDEGVTSLQPVVATPLSCPSVEVEIPHRSHLIYQARRKLEELEWYKEGAACSCAARTDKGRCPRAVSFEIPDDSAETHARRCKKLPPLRNFTNGLIQVDFLVEGRLSRIMSCDGALKVSPGQSSTNFVLFGNATAPMSNITYFRLDTYRLQSFVFGQGGFEQGAVTLNFDGQDLVCFLDPGVAQNEKQCGDLERGVSVPVIIISMNVASNPEHYGMKNKWNPGQAYCVQCVPIFPQLLPLVFRDFKGEARSADLTLISMGDLETQAVLINSSLAHGEGDPERGCPQVEPGDSAGPSFEELRAQSKVPPHNLVGGSWCVVLTGQCSLASKYKMCQLGGALGVIVMQAPESPALRPGEIRLGVNDSLSDFAIPVIYVGYNETFLSALRARKVPIVAAGPSIGKRPPPYCPEPRQGVSVTNQISRQSTFQRTPFTSVWWMVHSRVRNLLFVCTAKHELLILDTSRPESELPVVGKAPVKNCQRSRKPGENYLVDIRRGAVFVTILVEPQSRKQLLLFDTTSINAWRPLPPPSWPDDDQRMAAARIVPTEDGHSVLVALRRGNETAPRIHVLQLPISNNGRVLQPLWQGEVTMPAAAAGLRVLDMACDVSNLCLAALNRGSFLAVDLADGPQRLRTVAWHQRRQAQGRETNETIAANITGAQVRASRSEPGKFFVMRWQVGDQEQVLGRVMKVEVENFVRLKSPLPSPDLLNPTVVFGLRFGRSWSEIKQILAPGDPSNQLKDLLMTRLQDALRIDGSRLQPQELLLDGEVPVFVMAILAGEGPSPDTLLMMLQRQLVTRGSAIKSGGLKQILDGAMVEKGQPRRPSGYAEAEEVPTREGFMSFMTLTSIMMLTCLGLCGIAVTLLAAVRSQFRRRPRSLDGIFTTETNTRSNREWNHDDQGDNAGWFEAGAMSTVAPGFILGRSGVTGERNPARTSATSAQDALQGTDMVVGRPVLLTALSPMGRSPMGASPAAPATLKPPASPNHTEAPPPPGPAREEL